MGQMQEALDLINEEHARNPKFNYDTYPYNAFSTYIGSTVFEDGCFDSWGGKDYSDIMLTEEPYKNVRCTKEIFDDARKNHPQMLAATAWAIRELPALSQGYWANMSEKKASWI